MNFHKMCPADKMHKSFLVLKNVLTLRDVDKNAHCALRISLEEWLLFVSSLYTSTKVQKRNAITYVLGMLSGTHWARSITISNQYL